MSNVALERSYRDCQKIASSSGSNFFRSFYLLRPDRRRGMMALYAFARVVDDWGDDTSDSPVANQGTEWHDWIDTCRASSLDVPKSRQSSFKKFDSIRLALADTIDRFSMPIQYLHDLVDGVASDLIGNVSISDREQLDRYCYLVASSVGLACLSIWGGNGTDVDEAAIHCGIAFQLTNILRDVREDGERGRIYVPADLMFAHNVDPERWRAGQPDGDWRAVLETLVGWARIEYRSGWNVFDALDVDGQRMFSLMWESYRRLLERIANNLDTVWERRVCLTRFEKTSLYLKHAVTPWYRQMRSRNGGYG